MKSLIIKFSKLLKKSKKVIFPGAAVLLALILVIGWNYYHSKSASAAWFNDSWAYRVSLLLPNHTALQNNVYLTLTIDTSTLVSAGKLQSDCGDLRFTKQNGDLLSYYIISGCNSVSTSINVNFKTYEAGIATIYYYYGNPDAPNGFSLTNFTTSASNNSSSTNVGPIQPGTSSDDAHQQDMGPTGKSPTSGVNVYLTGQGYGDAGNCDAAVCIRIGTQNGANQNYDAGFRFTNVTVPQGSSISSATIKLTGAITYNAGGAGHTIKAIISMQDADDTNTFGASGSGNDLIAGSRTRTSNDSGEIDITTVAQDTEYTYDITDAVQEVVSRASWDSGHSMVALADVTSTDLNEWQDYYSYDHTPSKAAKLSITYGSALSVTAGSEETSSGPVVYWKFDEGYGTVTNNIGVGGTVSNGVLSGAVLPTWQAENQCVSGKCLYFDGSNSYVLTGNSAPINNWSTQSISLWFNSNNSMVSFARLIEKGANSEWALIFNGTANSGRLGIQAGSATALESSKSLTDGKWHHVVVTIASDYFISLYVDGKLDASATASVTPSSKNGDIYIGKYGGGNSHYFKGYIDDVKIYNYVRTAAEIKADFNSNGASKGTAANMGGGDQGYLSNGLVGYWKMDESSGTPVTDSSGNSNAGTLTNAQESASGLNSSTTTSITDTDYAGLSSADDVYIGMILSMSGASCNVLGEQRTISDYVGATKVITVSTAYSAAPSTTLCTYTILHQTPGKYGNGLKFDGINDYVTTSDNASLSPTNFTISFWLKKNSEPADYARIVQKFYNTAPKQGWSVLFNNTTPTRKVYIDVRDTTGNNGADTISLTTPLPIGEWRYYTYTFNGSVVSAYENGILVGTAPFIGTLSTTTNYLMFATESGTGNFAPITMDETRFYNRALSGKEISDLYNWAPGPIGYWNFEEGSGVTAYDTSGNSYNGIFGTNNIRYDIGKYGKSVRFDGSGSTSVNVTNIPFPSLQGTVEVWFNTTEADGTYDILGVGTGGNDFRLSPANNLYGFFIGSDYRVSYGTDPPANTWKHMTLTWDQTNGSILYIDGVRVASNSTPPPAFNQTTMSIGGFDGSNLIGKIDDVRVYNYTRTQKQIVSDMNGGHPSVGSPIGSAIGHWKFDEGAGATVNNSGYGGSTLNGTLGIGTSAPAWTNDGKFGKALDFDGTAGKTNYVQTGYTTSPGTGEITISAWIKPDSGGTGWGQIVSQMNYSNPTWWTTTFFHYSRQWKYLTFQNGWTTGWGQWETNENSITPGVWNHVAVIYSGSSTSNNASFYINGVPQAINAANTHVPTGAIESSTRNYYIGARENGANYFFGSIDEVKIYNYALTADEVKTDMNQGKALVLGALGNNSSYQPNAANQEYCIPGDTSVCTAPIGRWDFEEGTGGTVKDSSGNGNTGTWEGTGNHWITGKIGKGGNFNGNGTDDSVDAGNSTQFQSTRGTWEAWVYFRPSSGNLDANAILAYTDTDRNWNDVLAIKTDWDRQLIVVNRVGSEAYPYRWEGPTGIYMPVNQWTHLTLVQDGVAPKVYINGVLRMTVSVGNDLTAWTSAQSQQRFKINHPVGGGYENAIIDDVRVYNYARTPAQIAWDYNKGAPIARYKMDECQGTVINDASGKLNTGTLTIGTGAGAGKQDSAGTCTTSGATAWYNGRTGKYNSSVNLDGIDDFVKISNISGFNNSGGSLSVSAWVKTTTRGSSAIIFSNYDGSNTYGCQIYIDPTTGKAAMWGDNSNSFTANKVLDDGQWHHVVGKVSNAVGTLYVDGGNKASSGITCRDTTRDNQIGAQCEGAGSTTCAATQYLTGQVDDVQLFTYPLTDTQVELLYNQGSAVRFGPTSGTP